MKIGVVGDIHAPFAHPMYLKFCQDTFEAWGCNKVHFIGDVVDNHAISFHTTEHDAQSAGDEAALARKEVAKWVKSFPKATVSIGNHDALHFRKAHKEGLPECFLRGYQEVWGTPKWDWQLFHIFDGVRYQHGTGSSGKDAAINQAIARRKSVVQGHTHCWAGVKHHANDDDRIFGMNVGCGIDLTSYSQRYGKDFPIRPVLGCGVVLDGVPYFEAMPCGHGERYHRSKSRRKT